MINIKLKEFTCRECGTKFLLKAKKAYYCERCRKKLNSIRVMQERYKKDPNIKIGVGSGGNQWGENNSQYIDGRSHYAEKFHRNIKRDCCSICLSKKNLVVHHLDKNRKNNKMSNLILLCRSCHAKVHDIEQNFTRSKNQ